MLSHKSHLGWTPLETVSTKNYFFKKTKIKLHFFFAFSGWWNWSLWIIQHIQHLSRPVSVPSHEVTQNLLQLSFHRIIESQHVLSWKGHIRIIQYPVQYPALHRTPKSHTMCLRALELRQVMLWPLPWGAQPPSLSEEPFPDIQPNPRLPQLHAILLGPVTGPQKEEISACPSTSLHEKAANCTEVSSRLNKPSDLSCSSYDFPSRSFTLFTALFWMPSSSFVILLIMWHSKLHISEEQCQCLTKGCCLKLCPPQTHKWYPPFLLLIFLLMMSITLCLLTVEYQYYFFP